MEIIDFHVQAYPGELSQLLPQKARSRLRLALSPFSYALHESRPFFRFLPGLGKTLLDQVSNHLLEKPFLLSESTLEDLRHAMTESNITKAILVPDRSRATNEFVLSTALQNPHLIPAVELDGLIENPVEHLRELQKRGARVLKISRERPDTLPLSIHLELAQEASALRMHVLLEGLTDASEILRELGEGPAILAHLGGSDASSALDLGEVFPNLFVTTSRQPVETIAEAVRRLGAHRVLYSSDWPHAGNNIPISLRRIRDAVRFEMIPESAADQILYLNARKLLEGTFHGSSA